MFRMLNERKAKAERIEIEATEIAEAKRDTQRRGDQLLQEARKAADDLLKQTGTDAEALRASLVHKTERDIADMKIRAERDAARERERVITETQGELANLALLAAEKVLERSVRTEDSERFAREALAAMKRI